MATSRHLYWLVAGLVLLGTGLFVYKATVLKYPLVPARQVQLWDIEAKLRIRPASGPVKVTLLIPAGDKRYAVADEQFVSSGYGLVIKRSEGNRLAVWSSRRARGEQYLYYRGSIRPKAEASIPSTYSPPLPEVTLVEAQRLAADSLLAEARSRSADSETLVFEIFKRLNQKGESLQDEVRVLLGKNPDMVKRMQVARQLLSLEKIPSRIVNGVQLADIERHSRVRHWLEVFQGHAWQAYDPVTGQQSIPDNFLSWWRGSQPMVAIRGGKLLSANISVSRNEEPAVNQALWREAGRRPLLYDFSLLSLPVDTQVVYRTLLSVPLGVLVLVLLRNLIGIKTFGTFMPVLIALAFRETQLFWGIVLFSLVVGMGLSLRFYLDKLKLLLVPRLAAVLITVILIMALISILSHKLGLYHGLSVALFPMVIMTMTIERMSIVWEERGAAEALKQGGGSLLVASLAYLVMNLEILRHLLFMFPELLLVLLAVTMLLGRYSGYRLLELYRFKALTRDHQ